MKTYYRERAPVYDRVYAYPERQRDLRQLEAQVSDHFAGCKVLEIAAGTGYWTQFIGLNAQSITVLDAADSALDILQRREIQCAINVQAGDAYAMDDLGTNFDAAFAGLWFSHIPIERRRAWLERLHDHLLPGARVMLIDNTSIQCERLPITRTDSRGNTYQQRTTDAGRTYEVLKNFPSEPELREAIRDFGSNIEYQWFEHFWAVCYQAGQGFADQNCTR